MKKSIKPQLKKITWHDCRHTFKRLAKDIYDCIEEINPSDDFYLYEAEYRYGDELLCKDGCLKLPSSNEELIRLDDDAVPKRIQKDLGYNYNAMPLALICSGKIEIFSRGIDNISSMEENYLPGTVLAIRALLSRKKIYTNQTSLQLHVGAKSAFLTCPLGNKKNFNSLRQAYQLRCQLPNNESLHFELFKELARKCESPWRCKLIFIPVKWFNKIKAKKEHAWALLHLALIHISWNLLDYKKHSNNIDSLWLSYIEKINDKTIDKYVRYVTAHLIRASLGGDNLLQVCDQDKQGPFTLITNAIMEDYAPGDHLPVMISSANMCNRDEKLPAYVSLKQLSRPPKFKIHLKKRSLLNYSESIFSTFINFIEHLESMHDHIKYNPLIELLKYNYELFSYSPKSNGQAQESNKIFDDNPAVIALRETFPNKRLINSSTNNFLTSCIKIKNK